jgi:hypothetical protein
MKELFDLLEKRERKVLVVLGVLFLVSFLFLELFAFPKKGSYRHAVQTLPLQQKEYAQIRDGNKDIKREWLQWDEARRDIVEIEKKYFYRGSRSISQLRLDIRKIFRAARIRVVSDLIFDYADWETENLKRVRANFTLAGSYAALKRFIHQVEIHPKFLMIERIDFRDIDAQSGQVELNIVLAGYYEN